MVSGVLRLTYPLLNPPPRLASPKMSPLNPLTESERHE
jgi:hypothetical protein